MGEALPDATKSPLRSPILSIIAEDSDKEIILETLRSGRFFDIFEDLFEEAPPSGSPPNKKHREDGTFGEELRQRGHKLTRLTDQQLEKADLTTEVLGKEGDEVVTFAEVGSSM